MHGLASSKGRLSRTCLKALVKQTEIRLFFALFSILELALRISRIAASSKDQTIPELHGPGAARFDSGASIRAKMDGEYILETKNLFKEFKGFAAVSDVNLKVRPGAIHALIGPNGAGKTTVFNLLTKFLIPTRGTIHFRGQDITKEKPAEIARRGVVRSFQISAVFPHLTVLENVRVGLQRQLKNSFHFWQGEAVLKSLDERGMELLASVGLESHANVVAVELPYGRKRALEIATTLALDPELLLLDEPTQGMAHEDVDRVKDLIRKVAANRTVLMVEHNMSVVADLSDRITVLQRGSMIAEGSYSEVSTNPQVMEAYMGVADD